MLKLGLPLSLRSPLRGSCDILSLILPLRPSEALLQTTNTSRVPKVQKAK